MKLAKKPFISIVIPVLNEEKSILATLTSLGQVMVKNKINHEIIVVNDGSTDNTDKILKKIKRKNFSVIRHPENRGYGASLKTGIKSARHPWILITDADGSYPLDRIPALLKHTHNNDMVIGSREGSGVHDTFPRKIGRGIVRRFASYISETKIKDINSGLRIFKKENAEKFWHLFPEGFSFTSTLTVASHSKGHRVKYLPINYNKRVGKSSIKPARDFVGFLSLIARLAIYYKPLKVFVPLALFLFVLSWAVLAYGYFVMGQVLDATWAILFITSIQVLIFGFLADMIVKRFYND